MTIRTTDLGPDREALAVKTACGTMHADHRPARGRARAIGALALAAGCSTAASAAPAASSAASCTFGAFVQESDPAGLDVRAAPNAAARVLGAFPPGVVDHANGGFVARVEL